MKNKNFWEKIRNYQCIYNKQYYNGTKNGYFRTRKK